jgi:hypothetical protein
MHSSGSVWYGIGLRRAETCKSCNARYSMPCVRTETDHDERMPPAEERKETKKMSPSPLLAAWYADAYVWLRAVLEAC